MAGIVISYRRADSRWIVGRIYDRLEAQFGRDAVFMDIDGIPLGQDFRVHLKDILDRCSVLIAVIGPHWLRDASGTSRLQDESDWVRLEIETALARGVPVIPVLIDDTPLPQAADLPDGLRDLAFRQSARVSADVDFQPNMERLIRTLSDYVRAPAVSTAPSAAAAPPAPGTAGADASGPRGSTADRVVAAAEKLNKFSPIRFVVRWMVAAFLVYLGYQMIFGHSSDKDDEDRPTVSVTVPASPTPGAGTPNVGAIVGSAMQAAAGAKQQWKSAVEASAGCWHRVTGADNATFGEYVRLVPYETGVDIGTGKDAASLKKKGAKLERHPLADGQGPSLGSLIFTVQPWMITNDTVGHLVVVDTSKKNGAEDPLMYERTECPD